MKIETIKNPMAYFSDIDCGECFITRNYPYMRITDSKFNDGENGYINAVNLANGVCTYMYANTEVKKVNARLVIEE